MQYGLIPVSIFCFVFALYFYRDSKKFGTKVFYPHAMICFIAGMLSLVGVFLSYQTFHTICFCIKFGFGFIAFGFMFAVSVRTAWLETRAQNPQLGLPICMGIGSLAIFLFVAYRLMQFLGYYF